MELVREKLEEALKLEKPPLTGCVRRTIWDWEQDQDPPYRMWRGNALLAAIGDKRTANTPAGPFEYFQLEHWLLQFRGGEWNDYWKEDFFLEHDMVYLYGPSVPLSDTIIVLHENYGELNIRMVPFPETSEHGSFWDEAFSKLEADPPGRLAKNTSRAYRICSRCPYKQRCDATDKARGHTEDWGPDYPVP